MTTISKENVLVHFTKVHFDRFKAFESFTLIIKSFNVIVGPNNAGKSTILAAFRILAAGIRKANSKNPELLNDYSKYGYRVSITQLSIAENNIFYNYDDSAEASIVFYLSNKNKIKVVFTPDRQCFMIPESVNRVVKSVGDFKKEFNCPISYIPILGPLEHDEPRFEKEAARVALYNFGASRNFRNIWFHFNEDFEIFRDLIRKTWPGVDVHSPEVIFNSDRPILRMFTEENRILREISWSGFGFQVWCQMITYIIRSKESSLFFIDEPDIYLHPDIQRHMISILKKIGPDILLATHSTEIIAECDPDDIVIINKNHRFGYRLKSSFQLGEVYNTLGSNQNPVLTQIAKTKRVLFVEGKDNKIISKFGNKLNSRSVASSVNYAVIAIDGFNTDRIKSLKKGISEALGIDVKVAAILDRDYRSEDECESIRRSLKNVCDFVHIHKRKEIENYLIVEGAIESAVRYRLRERSRREGVTVDYTPRFQLYRDSYYEAMKNGLMAQYLKYRRNFERDKNQGKDISVTDTIYINEFDSMWRIVDRRVELIPGKEFISHINQRLQDDLGISISATLIIDHMDKSLIPMELVELIRQLDFFSVC